MGQAQTTNTSPSTQNRNPPSNPVTQPTTNQPKIDNNPFSNQIPQNMGYNNPSMPYNQMQQLQKPKYIAVITSSDLKEVFKQFSIDGKYLNKSRFNDTIEKLFKNINIPSMHYTYLSDRIYDLLDESQDGKISEDEFLNGLKNVLTDKEFRTRLTMMAMMGRRENRDYIELNEISDFFFRSWVYGYKHLGWQVKRDRSKILFLNLPIDEFISKNVPTPSITQFELWANKFENHIRIYLQNDFRECGLNTNRPMDIETFKKWIYRNHNLYLTYTFKEVTIATSLTYLDEVGFEDTNFKYPGFR